LRRAELAFNLADRLREVLIAALRSGEALVIAQPFESDGLTVDGPVFVGRYGDGEPVPSPQR